MNDAAWPRITLITAVYNGERYLEETIRSVVEQRYPNLEYIVVNDGSTDRSLEIIREYEKHLAGWVNQANKGLYAALNAGFARSSGAILGWLNANDKLHTNGLFVVGSVFRDLPEVEWITGRPTGYNDEGMTVAIDPVQRWSRYRFLAGGSHRHIQQESTFWRRGLWEKAGGCLDESFRAEGDFELWVRFFRHARLYSVDALIAGWRFHPDSLSHGNVDDYNRRCDEIADAEKSGLPWGKWFERYRRADLVLRRVPKVRGLWARAKELALRGIYQVPGADWPAVIEFKSGRWGFRK